MLTYSEAQDKLHELLTNPNLIKHCQAVEAAMRFYAKQNNCTPEEEEQWAIAGLLHDADWEKHPQDHPQIIVQWLKEQGESETLQNAIASHGFELGVEPASPMAYTLRAVDELTGLITAVALVKGRKLENVTVESVLKKWHKKDFAGGVKREDIEHGARDLNIPLETHIANVLSSMQQISDTLGL